MSSSAQEGNMQREVVDLLLFCFRQQVQPFCPALGEIDFQSMESRSGY